MAILLIVDDMEQYVDSIERALYKHTIIKAHSLTEAQAVCTPLVELALVDVRLNENDIANRDGILLLDWLKQKFPQIPVVIMSGYSDHDAAVNALNLGAVKYLQKPISLDDLYKVVDEHTGNPSEGKTP